MSKAIKRIQKYQEYFGLSDRQTVYLLYKYHGISSNIGAKELIELMDRDILDEEGDFVENLATITSITSKKIKTIKPKFESDLSKEVYSYLMRNTCYMNPYTKRPISINPESIKLNAEAKLKRYEDRCVEILKKETTFYKPYNVFLSLFPTAPMASEGDNPDNTRWTSFFKVVYSGVNLRKKTNTNTKRFLNIVKTKDTGVFLYGLYLYIRSGIKGDQTFIGGQATFFAEWEDWYETAENKIDEETSVDKLFKQNTSSGNFKGGIIL